MKFKNKQKKIRKRGIVFRTALLVWVSITTAMLLFIASTIQYQIKSFIKLMEIESDDTINTLVHIHEHNLLKENYPEVIEHISDFIRTNNSLIYIIFSKHDGTTFYFTKNNWEMRTSPIISMSKTEPDESEMIYSSLANRIIFKTSRKFNSTGVFWGWIHTGLSIDRYNKFLDALLLRTVVSFGSLLIIGFAFAFYSSRRITEPIRTLSNISKSIAEGNLDVRAQICTGDELEDLANSFNKMAESIQQYRAELETKVANRTADLAQAVKALQSEIVTRKKAESSLNIYTHQLEGLQEIYRGLISAKSRDEIIFTTLSKLRKDILEFDSAFVILYLKEQGEAVSHEYIKNIDGDLQQLSKNKIEYYNPKRFEEIDFYILDANHKSQLTSPFIQYMIGENGKSFLCLSLQFQEELIGEIIFVSWDPYKYSEKDFDIILEFRNQLAVVIAQSRLEENLRTQAKDLSESLREKEVLLKEIHHRVKNNLQIISSLLYLQTRDISDPKLIEMFTDSQNRIRSMALVHEKLYQSKDISSINFNDYIKSLATYISNSYNGSKNINIIFNMDNVLLPIDIAAPLGLILSELLSNCYKYSFPDSVLDSTIDKTIEITFSQNDKNCLFSIADNGIGLANDFNIYETTSLGLKLVTSLVNQIEGELTINAKDKTEFRILFSLT